MAAIITKDHILNQRMQLGQQLQFLIDTRGLTHQQVADATGLKQQNISRIISGKYSTGIDIINTIARALDAELILQPL